MRVDDYELDATHALERRLGRDDEQERFDKRRMRVRRRPSYSRFRTLARITDAVQAQANGDVFLDQAA